MSSRELVQLNVASLVMEVHRYVRQTESSGHVTIIVRPSREASMARQAEGRSSLNDEPSITIQASYVLQDHAPSLLPPNTQALYFGSRYIVVVAEVGSHPELLVDLSVLRRHLAKTIVNIAAVSSAWPLSGEPQNEVLSRLSGELRGVL